MISILFSVCLIIFLLYPGSIVEEGIVEVNFMRNRSIPRIDRGSIYECDSGKGIERVDGDAASAS